MLKNTIEIPVRFSEVDSLRVVWHGHYLKYFEDGREAFGRQYNLEYYDIFNADGLAVPIVDVQMQFRKPLLYGDSAIIETHFINSPAAKLVFEYKIFSAKDKSLACSGQTTQVFMNPTNMDLYITVPPYIEAWKEKHKLL